MSLNKISKTYLELNNSLILLYPKKKKQINLLMQSLRELTDNLIYEDVKQNNNRYPYYNNNIKLNSIVTRCKKIINFSQNRNTKNQSILNELVEIYVQLKWFQWYITDARKSLKSIINLVENNQQVKKNCKRKKMPVKVFKILT